MSNSDDDHVDEEIRQSTAYLKGLRKERKLAELQELKAQIAVEREWLQLHKARQSVDSDNSASVNHQFPVVSQLPVDQNLPAHSKSLASSLSPDLIEDAINDLVETVRTSSGRGNNGMLENGQAFADSHMISDYRRIQGEPTPHQGATEPKTTTSLPIEAQIFNGEVKQESPDPTIRDNDAPSRSGPSEIREKERNGKQSAPYSESVHQPDQRSDADSLQLQTSTQSPSPWTFAQSAPTPRATTLPNPPDIVGTYQGRRWADCVYYIYNLEVHFARYPNYYTEARKVELGAKYISPTLMDAWHHHKEASGTTTWMSYCTFLAQQLARGATPEQAINGIKTATQKNAQPVTHFALWLIQWAPVVPHVCSKDFMAALLRGAHADIRASVQESNLRFSNYTSLVTYLQEVEDSIPSRQFLSKRKNLDIENSGKMNGTKRKRHELLPSERPNPPPSQFERWTLRNTSAPQDLRPYSPRNWRNAKSSYPT